MPKTVARMHSDGSDACMIVCVYTCTPQHIYYTCIRNTDTTCSNGKHTCLYTPPPTHTHTLIHTHTHSYAHIHSHSHSLTHTLTNTHSHSHAHPSTHIKFLDPELNHMCQTQSTHSSICMRVCVYASVLYAHTLCTHCKVQCMRRTSTLYAIAKVIKQT